MPTTRSVSRLRLFLENILGNINQNEINNTLRTSPESSSDSSVYSSLADLFHIENSFNNKMAENNNPPFGNRKIKLPIYNAGSTENWFMMVDTVLEQHNIDNELAKALEVLAVLPIETQDHVASLIAANPDDVYEQLKKKITDLNRPPYRQRMREFVSTVPMGDRKPTEYLLYLRKKLGISTGTSEILDITFKEGLGENMRFALHSFEGNDINDYANEADQIFHLRNNVTSKTINQVTDAPHHSTNSLVETNATLVNRVLELERSLAATRIAGEENVASVQEKGQNWASVKDNQKFSKQNYSNLQPNSYAKQNSNFQQSSESYPANKYYNYKQKHPNYSANNFQQQPQFNSASNFQQQPQFHPANNFQQQPQFYSGNSYQQPFQHYTANNLQDANQKQQFHQNYPNRNYLHFRQSYNPNQRFHNFNNKKDSTLRSSSPAGPKSWCRYHRMFGATAHNCEPGCTYPNSSLSFGRNINQEN